MLMKIEPEYIHQLYEYWKRVPKCASFAVDENKACPLGILYLDDHFGVMDKNGVDVAAWSNREYGAYFTNGFYAGFDDLYKDRTIWKNLDEKQGYVNGQAVREYLKQFYSF
jgi:hypothetical protein